MIGDRLPAPKRHDHAYLSTACFHGIHDQCRLTCKFCHVPCRCDCHERRTND